MEERLELLNMQASAVPTTGRGASQQYNKRLFSFHVEDSPQPAARCFNWKYFTVLVCLALCLAWIVPADSVAAGLDSQPPATPLKLIFIHHSCGENWLADDNGGLAKVLQKNNYFVSDTNYGWGPEAIGDRTDIENWPEWFTGPQSPGYLKALYQENEIHSPYQRTMADPGGENRVIMFKSCFPNSELEGNPNDPPRRGDGLTVGNAKAIYLELLGYFSTHPEKLFIAVTAPPVQNRSRSQNARAFNTWLVRDWLKDYTGSNVAVFDFYNVLTGKGHRHTIQNGAVLYVNDSGRHTLAYPVDSGDDHPSRSGNTKATADFLPLLNAYVNQWLKTAPTVRLPEPYSSSVTQSVSAPPAPPAQSPASGVEDIIDDFEGNGPQWDTWMDGDPGTQLTGARDSSMAHGGRSCLRLDYRVVPNGWATYSLVYQSPRSWADKSGLALFVHAEKVDLPVSITAYGGNSPDALRHFEYQTVTDSAAVNGWQKIEIYWDRFKQPLWDGDGQTPFDPDRAMGLALVFGADESKPNQSRIWVDDLHFLTDRSID
jgi:hypothetical protein